MPIIPIPPDPNAAQGAANARNASAAGGGNSFAGTMAGLSQTFGPAGYYAAAAYQPGAAPIIGAAVNATAGGPYGAMPYGGTGVNPYVGANVSGGVGGAALGVGGSIGGGGDVLAQARQIAAEGHVSQVATLGLQQTIQQDGFNMNVLSNVIKARSDTQMGVVHNIRTS